ncbi:MAG: hypothetical protein Q9162_002157 [Coniocarpon cinnabarinum]
MIATEQEYNPIVLAVFRAAHDCSSRHAKKILFYGHYDVIAAENRQNSWSQDPFTLTGRDGYLYGRGVSDNKGPIVAAAHAVADLARSTRLKSDIVFLIEGEEECGSRGFENAVRRHRDLIGHVDCILVANSYWINNEVPCLTYGLRGVLHATVHVENEWPDFHSGVDGSRSLDEPLKDLVTIMSRLSGAQGAINLPGFEDCVLPLTDSEQRLYDEVAQSLTRSDPTLGDPESLANSFKQRWREPSLTIHNFKTSGSEKSTIIPHCASVSLSMRLVPNQQVSSVAKSLETFLRCQFEGLSSSNTLSVRIHQTAEPWLGDPSNELFQTLESAVKHVWTQKNRRRASADPASPMTNRSHLRQHFRAASRPRTATLATSTTLTSSNFTCDERNSKLASNQSSDPESRPEVLSPERRSSAMENPDWRPLYIREGGSIPAIRYLEQEFNAPAAQLPCGQASDNAHLDNERLRVINLFNSREIFRRVFEQLASP